MSGTLARCLPTNGAAATADAHRAPPLRLGTCQAFVAPVPDGTQDQATAQQDPDIAVTVPVDRLASMPVSLPTAVLRWLRAVASTLAERFRKPSDPSSSSPATGRSAVRAPFAGTRASFREFTLPRSVAHADTRRASLPERTAP
ncbi:hypothetical protein [Pseudoxanthomonas sp.]|jgi:hypothetical protein|uniref:hypothetical protein n=1 Tax=Pseudoxanthomonas sp. TaxID=1871049 RepID=UPI002FDF449D